MAERTIGVVVEDSTPQGIFSTIRRLERAGVPAAWMTSAAGPCDVLTVYAAAIVQTERIRLGTSVVRSWSRHPITLAEQARAVWDLAPGRLALGVGPAHKASMEHDFGQPYDRPLGHLEEYVRVLKDLLQGGEVHLEGSFYTARARAGGGVDIPVHASALRPRSFELCGRVADGAITWVCPLDYVRDQALPVLRRAAGAAGRKAPAMIVHVPVCLTGDAGEARAALRERLGYFPGSTNYSRMFEMAGFPGSDRTGWTDELADAVMVHGSAATVSRRLDEMFGWGADELVVTVLGDGRQWDRTAALLSDLSRG